MNTAALRQCQKRIYLKKKAKFLIKISVCFPSFPGVKKILEALMYKSKVPNVLDVLI